jgi:hypothetical protein
VKEREATQAREREKRERRKAGVGPDWGGARRKAVVGWHVNGPGWEGRGGERRAGGRGGNKRYHYLIVFLAYINKLWGRGGNESEFVREALIVLYNLRRNLIDLAQDTNCLTIPRFNVVYGHFFGFFQIRILCRFKLQSY